MDGLDVQTATIRIRNAALLGVCQAHGSTRICCHKT